MVIYLLDNTQKELIWGNLSGNQKKYLLVATRNHNNIRENLINIFTDYTTLNELKEGVTKNKTLNRFIKK